MAEAWTGMRFCCAVGDHLGAAGELVPEPGVAPRGDDLQLGREAGGGQLEADLVVAFAGGAVGHGLGLFLRGDLDHALGDERPGDAGAQEILALVDRAGLDHREDEVARELLLQVGDVALGRAGAFGLGFQALEFLLLADVGAEGDDLGVILFLEPGEDDGGIESARISENNLHSLVQIRSE